MSDLCAKEGFNVVLKSVDDSEPLVPSCRPKDRSGVAFSGHRILIRKLFTMEMIDCLYDCFVQRDVQFV